MQRVLILATTFVPGARYAAGFGPAALAPRRAAPRRALLRRCATAAPQDISLDASPAADTRELLTSAVRRALAAAFGGAYDAGDAAVTSSTRREFGDFQCNAAMGLGKKLGMKPRDIATRLVEELEKDAVLRSAFSEPLEIAGPGFINARLGDEWLSTTCLAMAADSTRVALPKCKAPQTVVVDYSSPNIAKEMHVGHLRSTVIGDAISNILELRGHAVVRQNHVGDWGTQFGMLIAHMQDVGGDTSASLTDLVAFYKAAKGRFDSDAEFKERARSKVVALQSGADEETAAWQKLCAASRTEFNAIYSRLGVTGLEEKGESSYNSMLQGVVDHLEASKLAEVSDGATVVFAAEDSEKEKPPLIVRKSDGGFNYASTDLAAAQYRSRDLGGQRLLYVTDSGQAQHFAQVFAVARRANLVPEACELTHVPFGLVQSDTGKKFATRSGETIRLKDLLDEAEKRALASISERRAERDESDLDLPAEDLARAVGIGAVKYADLALNRESNYRFSFDKMLALTGNTAPYMLYSYARINGIQRKVDGAFPSAEKLVFVDDAERGLARQLAMLTPTFAELERELRPNLLCDYLFELAQAFNRFYEACPVKDAETQELGASRATLCAATAAALKLGLTALGIPVVDRL
ncbi:tRNA synthetases class I (R)-domain-containing protein [Pelagophyceae sp. CCMP2097]|nr:tRNA synthetases class I (R)-domain-containing protein [Pelagophyceae sp. CCMP2097]